MRRSVQAPSQSQPATPPFSPSWLDGFQARIERLPLPWWATYLLALLAAEVLINISPWLDGSLPPLSIAPTRLVSGFIAVYFFGLIHYLNRAARRALANYRPLLELNEHDYAKQEFTLTKIPRPIGVAALALGALLGAANFRTAPESWGVIPNSSNAASTLMLLTAIVVDVGILYWITQVIRQGRTINRTHRMTTRLNILRRDPVYAFSALTLRSAVGVLLAAYSYLLLVYTQGLSLSAADVVTMSTVIAISVLIFALPLYRVHVLLADEKTRLLLAADQRYANVFDRFNQQVDKGRFADLDPTTRAIAALASQRDSLAKVSTWPWKPETLRSLIGTIALPIVLYLATRLVGRLVGL
jgi:hypothetical protein